MKVRTHFTIDPYQDWWPDPKHCIYVRSTIFISGIILSFHAWRPHNFRAVTSSIQRFYYFKIVHFYSYFSTMVVGGGLFLHYLILVLAIGKQWNLSCLYGKKTFSSFYGVLHILSQIYTANNVTFPVQMYAITVKGYQVFLSRATGCLRNYRKSIL